MSEIFQPSPGAVGSSPTEGRSALYRAAWRWHFYAGIFCIPMVVVLSLSGIVYLLQPQIDSVMYGDLRSVDPGTSTVSYQEQLETVQARYPEEPVVAVAPQISADRAVEFYLDNGGTGGFLPGGRTVYVDQYTAAPLVGIPFSQFGPMAKWTDWGISVHEGREWGVSSRVPMGLAASSILVSAVTAVVMWVKRRPQGVGAPRRLSERRRLVGLAAITATLGVLFPLLGVALVSIWIFDYLVQRRVPPLARAMGDV